MKKHPLLFSMAIWITLLFSLSGCRKPEYDPAIARQVAEAPLGSRTKTLMKIIEEAPNLRIKIKYDENTAGDSASRIADAHLQKDQQYLDIISPNKAFSLYHDGESTYAIFHKDKRYMKIFDLEPDFFNPLGATTFYQNAAYVTGTETINGVAYEYEQLTDMHHVLSDCFYYDASGKLTYIKSKDQLNEIHSLNFQVDKSKFNLPKDYFYDESKNLKS